MLPALTGLVASTGPVIEGGEDGKVNEIPDGKPSAALSVSYQLIYPLGFDHIVVGV